MTETGQGVAGGSPPHGGGDGRSPEGVEAEGGGDGRSPEGVCSLNKYRIRLSKFNSPIGRGRKPRSNSLGKRGLRPLPIEGAGELPRIFFLPLPIFLEEIHKWAREICISSEEIGKSKREIHISLIHLYISSRDSPIFQPTLPSLSANQSTVHRTNRGRRRVLG